MDPVVVKGAPNCNCHNRHLLQGVFWVQTQSLLKAKICNFPQIIAFSCSESSPGTRSELLFGAVRKLAFSFESDLENISAKEVWICQAYAWFWRVKLQMWCEMCCFQHACSVLGGLYWYCQAGRGEPDKTRLPDQLISRSQDPRQLSGCPLVSRATAQ